MSPRACRSPFALAATLLCVAALPASASSGGAPVPEKVAAELVGSLRAARDRAAPVADLTRRIEQNAVTGLPLLLTILGDERVPAPADDPEARVQQLSVVQRDMILNALERAGRERVLPSTDELFAAAPAADADFLALQVLGAVGSARDFERLLQHALDPDRTLLAERERLAFERAATRMLARDPETYEQLLRHAPNARPELLPSLLFAAGAARDPRGLAFVQQVLDRQPDLARIAISQVRLIGPSLSVQRNEELLRRVRPYLRPEEKETCQAAALALAELGDAESIPALLELLEHDSAGIRENALWALQRATGMSFPLDARIWTEWYEGELAWLADEAPGLIQQLSASDTSKVAEALKALTRHRLHRHQLAQRIGDELPRVSDELRVLICKTLGRLESPYAIPALLDAAEDRHVPLSIAAFEALLAVTRRDLGRDADTWRAALFAEE